MPPVFVPETPVGFSLKFLPGDTIECHRVREPSYCGAARRLADISRQRPDLGRAAPTTIARLTAETWIALATTVGRPDKQRVAYANRRVRNAWIHHRWPDIDEHLPQDPSPDRLALYLALGWTQATTTWQWPATERWIAEVGGEAPEHWLSRSQWHLCCLLHDPEDEDHRRGLDEALRAGLGDEERPGIAALLRELFPPSARR